MLEMSWAMRDLQFIHVLYKLRDEEICEEYFADGVKLCMRRGLDCLHELRWFMLNTDPLCRAFRLLFNGFY